MAGDYQQSCGDCLVDVWANIARCDISTTSSNGSSNLHRASRRTQFPGRNCLSGNGFVPIADEPRHFCWPTSRLYGLTQSGG